MERRMRGLEEQDDGFENLGDEPIRAADQTLELVLGALWRTSLIERIPALVQ